MLNYQRVTRSTPISGFPISKYQGLGLMIPPGGQSGRQEGCKARDSCHKVRYLDRRVYLFRHVMCIILILQTNYIYIYILYIYTYVYIYIYMCTEYCTHMEMYVEKLLTMG